MSNSTVKSNIVGKNGTEKITNFSQIGDSSTDLIGVSVSAGNYIKLGTHKYIISDDTVTAASILANAKVIDSDIKSSIVLGSDKIWYISGPATINYINATALS